jgi:D-alanyl-lipoteichoic acid acyltransferase DltB (MBOAT superfamily)
MLFNSFEFLLVFLPLAYVGFWLLMRRAADPKWAIGFLVLSSLFFYGWWDWRTIWVLTLSILVNFGFGQLILNETASGRRKLWLVAGLSFNLALLGWFKYAAWLAGMLQSHDLRELTQVGGVEGLPLGISFFTFQKIAFLADCYSKPPRRRYTVLDYALFVSFFPQLIAGPIVHHNELIPQLWRLKERFLGRHYIPRFLVPGLFLLATGLFKKVVLADIFGDFADDAFAGVGDKSFGFLDAWGGALAYTLQIYFDFSAYSDMALGLARLFALKLPVNFFSPYKAVSIIDFWRRWHMTLSRFLRDYLYIPLGGNRRGPARRYVNLMLTMLLGGLWHGASLTFLFWGGLHGLYLVVNHLWAGHVRLRLPRPLGIVLTFLAVVAAWVPFRANNLVDVLAFYRQMLAIDGIAIPWSLQPLLSGPIMAPLATLLNIHPDDVNRFAGMRQVLFLALGLVVAWGVPNCQELLTRRWRRRVLESKIIPWALGAATAASAIAMLVRQNATFLYFQF